MTEPHPSTARTLSTHPHEPLSRPPTTPPLSEETRARKAAPTPADHAVDHPRTDANKISALLSRLAPTPSTTCHATRPLGKPFFLFLVFAAALATWAGQLAGRPHDTWLLARATPSADRYLPVCPTSSLFLLLLFLSFSSFFSFFILSFFFLFCLPAITTDRKGMIIVGIWCSDEDVRVEFFFF